MNRKAIAHKLAFMVALCVAVSPAFAQQTKSLGMGSTRVTLSGTFLSALSSLGVTPGTVAPTELQGSTVNFPVVGGAIDLATAKGNIFHSGGLTLTAGGKQVTLQSFIIDTTGMPVITGLVSLNGTLLGRLPLFDVQLPSSFSTPLKLDGPVLRLKGLQLTLDATAAGALSNVFQATVPANLSVGSANVTLLFFRGRGYHYGMENQWGSNQ